MMVGWSGEHQVNCYLSLTLVDGQLVIPIFKHDADADLCAPVLAKCWNLSLRRLAPEIVLV